jgi:uncharacterized protein YcbX
MNVVVRACYLYPVKSCAAVAVDALVFDASGQIVGDREWVIVDEKGIMTWMGAVPRLALLQPERLADGWALRSVEGGAVPLPAGGEGAPCTVRAWNGSRGAFDSIAGRDGGDLLAAFVSRVTGKKLRVAWLATAEHRPNPVHLTTGASLQELARHLGASTERMAGHRRFRPNVVLDPAPGETLEAFAEEKVVAFTRAALRLEVTERCARCVVVDVDPDAGSTDERYLAGVKTHSARRFPGESAAYFGIYARPTAAGRLATGDLLTVTMVRGK